MSDLNVLYTEAKFWLPLLSIFGLVIKAYVNGKKSVSEWADSLLNNHLHGIENNTKSTESETKETNKLLRDYAGKLDTVQGTLHAHHERQLQVWHGVTEALVVLKERTRACNKTPKKRSTRGR